MRLQHGKLKIQYGQTGLGNFVNDARGLNLSTWDTSRIVRRHVPQGGNQSTLLHSQKSDALLISEGLDADALNILIYNGIQDRFRQQCKQFRQRSTAISSNTRSSKESEANRIREDVKRGELLLTEVFHQALVDAVIKKFSTFTHDFFPCPSTLDSAITDIPAGTRSSTFTVDPSLHPTGNEQERDLVRSIGIELRRKVHSEKINNRHFKDRKERICIASNVLRNSPDMPKGARESFIDVILHEDMSHVKETLKSISKGNFSRERPKGSVNVLWDKLSDVLADLDPRTFGKTLKEADADYISDAQLPMELSDDKMPGILEKFVEETRTAALDHFRSYLTKQTRALVHLALHTQTDQCLLQVQREAAIHEEEQITELWRAFIHEIDDFSQTGGDTKTLPITDIHLWPKGIFPGPCL
ncbi:hypothetical protein CY34DRAFT_759068 [Suillus luteus UH-Slu-Lm8-n1]|uniref:Uncharacterized protein n=1 Tax=Suillus luteus UH-Slu-Lm8-n1 TaxID=930992 RepID=A0A0C9Z4J8_9AGAM|nr:hypothetical protein CY34DRAFT_759068 [Suillus luteus UH-Slu-Lm8-n1]